jgi:NAD-dependent DNA ligase
MVDIKEKMADLVSYLNMRTAEYECGEPTISDEDWDNLYFQLV